MTVSHTLLVFGNFESFERYYSVECPSDGIYFALLFIYFLKDFIYFLERGRKGEREGEKH